MRMWKINPRDLCRQHLLGEHVECHMMAGSVARGHDLRGFTDGGLIEVHHIPDRHDALAAELTRRGYNHRSPIRLDVDYYRAGNVDTDRSWRDLCERCPACRERMAR